VPGKFFECFAAGGFMLIDRRPDLIAAFGEAADFVTYDTIEELNAKIEYFLTNESDRRELIAYFQDRIQRDHTAQAWLSRIVTDLRERAEARPRAKTA
jgi:spore maturation protein CgeB